MNTGLKASVKVRTEVMDKLALEQIANAEGLELSDIARRAFKLYIRTCTEAALQADSPKHAGTYGQR